MQKKFLKNLVFLLFLNLLVKPFWILGIDRTVQNMVGSREYGFYFAVFNFSYLFYIFLDLGITNFNNRNIARNHDQLKEHFGGMAVMKLLLGVVYGVLIFLVAWLIGYRGRQLYLLAWVGFNQFLLSFILYLRSNISGLLMFTVDSVLSVMDRILMIGMVGVLLWTGIFHGRFSIEWFVYAQTVAYLLTAAVAWVVLLKKSGKLTLRWDVDFFKLVLRRSFPFALLVLLMSFYSRMDSVMIERLLPVPVGDQQAGVYAQAFRLLDAAQNLAYLFAVLLLPLFSKMLKDKIPVDNLVRLAFSIMMTGVVIGAVTTHFFAKDLMQWMYPVRHGETAMAYQLRMEQSATIFRLLMWGFAGIASNYIFGTLLTANNNLRVLNGIALSGLIINFTLNFLLIPHYQAVGSAVATLVTQWGTAVLQLIFAFRLVRLNIRRDLWLRLFVLLAGTFLAGLLLQEAGILSWKMQLLLLPGVGLLMGVLMKTLDVKKFWLLVSEKTA
ncbi:polysaccharide biosynthesis C-terminal domain-containing protein [Candidatus Sulfidibacterium hydrothermale]|uniref:oligosaccharide flippase family protein n=1 Tax=Candidatus Sulfidibacterium hydrothermale TaxID=2875962 RepID=UPI001F0B0D99|nr:oligosaccharide flippase family protein [Candidatus Sulfidibacterium hydrothermale]UBM61123.1 polysaccharide biosynthesis C-terminal domain-containing protein [Candidatus Sulfidibacterium hydrothermale]